MSRDSPGPTPSLSARQIRDILRRHFEQRLTVRQIPQSVGVGLASVSGRIHRAEVAGLG